MSEKAGPFVIGKAVPLPGSGRPARDGRARAAARRGARAGEPFWSPEVARVALEADFASVRIRIDALPDGACPEGLVVVEIVLRPGRLSPASHPDRLLKALGLHILGSRSCSIVPRSVAPGPGGGDGPSGELPTFSLWVAGTKPLFAQIAGEILRLEPEPFRQLAYLEAVRFPSPGKRLSIPDSYEGEAYEAALHLLPGRHDLFPCRDFVAFAESLGFRSRRA
jgi:hypothetical protein